MIQIFLHDLILIDGSEKLWPSTFRDICKTIEQSIDPTLKAKKEQAQAQILEDIGEPAVVDPKDSEKPMHGPSPFDRNPLHPLADWCKENDEPWLERACKFLIRHEAICVERYSSYSSHYWRFTEKTMPERWKYMKTTLDSFAELLAVLAAEIKERLEQLGV